MSDQNVFRFWTSDWSGKQWADCDTYVDAVERILQDAFDDLSELNEKFKIEAEDEVEDEDEDEVDIWAEDEGDVTLPLAERKAIAANIAPIKQKVDGITQAIKQFLKEVNTSVPLCPVELYPQYQEMIKKCPAQPTAGAGAWDRYVEAMKEFDKAFDAVKQQGAYYDDVECTGMREPFSMMYYEDDDQA